MPKKQGSTKPVGGIGQEFLRRWFEKKKRDNPQVWMDAIVDILRSQPPMGLHTGTPSSQEVEQLRLRDWVFKNFSEI